MANFRYRALTRAGEERIGDVDGADAEQAAAWLQGQGLLPVEIREGSAFARWLQSGILSRRPSRREVALAIQALAALLDAGLPMDRALAIVGEGAAKSPLARVFTDVRERVRAGASLADAMARHDDVFPVAHTSMVRAGESAGALGPVLGRLAELLARTLALRETIRSALIYPAILLAMAGLAILFILLVVVPQFRALMSDAGVALPISTQIIFALSEFISAWWPAMVIALAAAALALERALRRPATVAALHAFVLRLPRVGALIRSSEAARLCRGLGTLLAGGVPAARALAIVQQTLANRAIAAALATAAPRLKEGRGFAVVIERTAMFPPVATQLARVGEETGRLDVMLIKAADLFDGEVRRGVDRLVALLVPVLTVLIGGVVAAVIASLFSVLLSFNELAL